MGETAVRRATVECVFCGTMNRVDLERAADRPKCGECGRPILLDRPVRVTDAGLARVVADATVPLMVDFYADWCGPCKVMAPLLDELARARMGRLLVAKLDTDRNPEATRRYGIQSIPTLVLFRDGEEAAREVGAIPRQRLEALVADA